MIVHGLTVLLVMLALTLSGGWAVLAVFYGDSHSSLLQSVIAGGVAIASCAAIIGSMLRRIRRRVLTAYCILFSAVLAWWLNITPSNDRHWESEVAHLPYASIEGDRVTVHNIRNFDYQSESEFTPRYESRSYDLTKLDSVDMFAVYWMGPAIAHVIVSFGFNGEDYLAISIEARKEQGESYSSIKGFFRQYELIYVVADERDVIRLRTNYRSNPPEDVYRYRLQGTPEVARGFFLEYLKAINALRDEPRFYNTLTTNCTNLIWLHAQVVADRIPFSWRILASGYSPAYLYDRGRLDNSVPFDELTRRGHVNPLAWNLDDGPDFSRRIRIAPSSTDAAMPARPGTTGENE